MVTVLGGTVGLFALLPATPVGWAADVLALGLAGVGGASAAVNIGDAINSVARIETESDRRDAARQLAQQLNGAVIDALLGLVGGNGGKIADKAKDGLESVGRIRGIGFEGLGANGGNIRIKLAPKANSRLDNLNNLADDAIDAAGKKADDAAEKVVDALKPGSDATTISNVAGKVPEVVPNGKTQRHHPDPKFMGGDPNQPLTDMPAKEHEELHRLLNDFLRDKTDGAGNHMRPQRGNSAIDIQNNFTRRERLDAMADFYKKNRDKFPDAARNFFQQHPDLE